LSSGRKFPQDNNKTPNSPQEDKLFSKLIKPPQFAY
jgi:hypothetical protein